MKKRRNSKALQEVWDWKDQAYREVENLDLERGLRKRLKDSLKATRDLGLAEEESAKGTPRR